MPEQLCSFPGHGNRTHERHQQRRSWALRTVVVLAGVECTVTTIVGGKRLVPKAADSVSVVRRLRKKSSYCKAFLKDCGNLRHEPMIGAVADVTMVCLCAEPVPLRAMPDMVVWGGCDTEEGGESSKEEREGRVCEEKCK